MTDKIFNVLFLCTGNSARSVFAECILRLHLQHEVERIGQVGLEAVEDEAS